ncbi:MAG: hypothetical protein SGJ05_01950 [bacterium]|nr:hypothetical protein [bacterium]
MSESESVGGLKKGHLDAELQAMYIERRQAILARLADFAAVPAKDWFYELCFCLLTPQSRASHADAVVRNLQEIGFRESGSDVLYILRNKDSYIRFHNVKHTRLHLLRQQWPVIEKLLLSAQMPEEKRDALAVLVNGMGLKEASHFLRNIGYLGLAIIDRHLLTNLVRCGLYTEVPRVGAPSQYRAVERDFRRFALDVGIALDELDLLFWSAQTGMILK